MMYSPNMSHMAGRGLRDTEADCAEYEMTSRRAGACFYISASFPAITCQISRFCQLGLCEIYVYPPSLCFLHQILMIRMLSVTAASHSVRRTARSLSPQMKGCSESKVFAKNLCFSRSYLKDKRGKHQLRLWEVQCRDSLKFKQFT